ncbi:MAG TPA: M28 family peptidase [Verrucomicrobiae bacterium]|nr:M28 family peptidase [Verrucomicrobiae bacterium]
MAARLIPSLAALRGHRNRIPSAVTDRRYRLLVLSILFSFGCSSKPPPPLQWNAFDGHKAYEQVEKIVGFGPRPSGSAALARSAAYIEQQLQSYGLTVEEQVFTAPTPYGPKQFRNIVAKTRIQHRGPDRIIIVGSHYDTKLFTNITFVGANDGGSSTGALLEMSRVAAQQPDLWFVFFDGEEAMVEYSDKDGLWGSRFFVQELKREHQVGSIKAMVLLDMIGDKNLNVWVTGSLVGPVFDASRAAGFRDYFDYRGNSILDDHVPFLQAGIPAVDLIDFEFGSAPGLNDYWHTDKDTLDKISPRSLEIIGKTTLRLLSLLQNQALPH